jgi:hypothetical protein
MHLKLVLVGLAALAAAAPVDKASDESMAGYDPYAKYGVYYETYTPYPASVEEEAAKMGMLKRDLNERGYGCYESYTPYSAAAEAEAAKMGLSKREYTCYNTYNSYNAAIEAEAQKEKRGYNCYDSYTPYSAATEAAAAKMNEHMAKRGYGCYESYNSYTASGEAEAEAAKMDVEKRHMMKMPKEMVEEDASMMEKRDDAEMKTDTYGSYK